MRPLVPETAAFKFQVDLKASTMTRITDRKARGDCTKTPRREPMRAQSFHKQKVLSRPKMRRDPPPRSAERPAYAKAAAGRRAAAERLERRSMDRNETA